MIARTLCLCFCLLFVVAPRGNLAAHQQMSPEMQKLVDELKAQAKQGKPPTAEQMAQLQKLTQQYQNHFGTPGNATVPCQVSVSMNYTATMADSPSISGWNETGSLSGSAPAVMTAMVNGNADYMKNPQGAGASMFTITTTQATGFGNATVTQHLAYTVKGKDPVSRSYTSNGNIAKAGAGIALMTTGGDNLYGRGSFNGPATGTTDWYDSGRKPTSGSEDWKPDSAVPLFAAFTQESQAQLKAGSAMPQPTAKISYSQLAKAIQSGSSTSITGTESFDITQGGIHYQGSSTVTITLRPSKTRLIIEPDDESVYEKWMPVPDSDDAGSASAEFPTSTPMTVHLALTDQSNPGGAVAKTKTKPHSAVSDVLDIDLTDVSNNPGICMNYPKSGATGKTGLYFPKTQPSGIQYVDEQHVKTTGAVVEATVTVNARDTGAYGQIEAKSETLKLTAIDLRTNKQMLSIPMDDNNNHIADVWEKNNKVDGKDATWDECNVPSGMKKTGDGISLYDKYRGLLLDNSANTETFVRVDPTVRNLFLYIPASQADKAIFQSGAAAYSRVTGIKVSYLHDSTRMRPTGTPDQSGGAITLNRTPFSEATDTFAVIIYDDGKTGTNGYTKPMDFIDVYDRYSPSTTQAVVIERQNCQTQVQTFIGWTSPPIGSFANTAKTQGINLTTVKQTATASLQSLVQQLMEFAVMHELGHATGAAHHGVEMLAAYDSHQIPLPPGKTYQDMQTQLAQSGSTNCPMFYWQGGINIKFNPVLMYLAGKWNPVMNSSTGAWAFCSADWPEMSLKP